jgi:hypothetical protein
VTDQNRRKFNVYYVLSPYENSPGQGVADVDADGVARGFSAGIGKLYLFRFDYTSIGSFRHEGGHGPGASAPR